MGEFGSWFATDADCLDYLEWMRWPAGLCCPSCGHDEGWRLGDRRFECARCRARTSTTAVTIFDRTRTPLTVWFAACWAFVSDKGGVSALGLQRSLEIGRSHSRGLLFYRVLELAVAGEPLRYRELIATRRPAAGHQELPAAPANRQPRSTTRQPTPANR